MTWKAFRTLGGGTSAVVAGVLFGLTVGGCPQAQVPDPLPDNSNGNSNQDTRTGGETNANTIQRPIPPVPVDVGGNANSGGPVTPTGDFFQPIAIAISQPAGFDINVAPGGEGVISYETGGGNPADGPVGVQFFYDVDGIANTGDEVTLLTGLAPRGSQRFTASLPPGIYRIGLRAANSKDSKVTYATGKLVVVGTPGVQISQPAADLRVRPNSTFQAILSINSLASAVTYDVLIDSDTTINGNERKVFAGAGLGGPVTIVTDGLAAGNYFLAVTARDSVGQTKTEYNKTAQGTPRKITIDLAPSIAVLSPTSFDPVHPVPFELRVRGADPEGTATVTLIRDGDAGFNGNEVPLQTFQITAPGEQEFALQIDPATLTPGTYRFGATISDGVGEPLFSYSAVPVPRNGPPTVSVTLPAVLTHVVYGSTFELRWNASDFEGRSLAGFNILFAIDGDGDGQPDAPPAPIVNGFGQPITLGGTASFTTFDTNGFPGAFTAINPQGVTLIHVGVRAIDDLGATTDAMAAAPVSVELPACCFPDGTCAPNLSAADCTNFGGCNSGGLTTPCAGVTCPVLTACTFPTPGGPVCFTIPFDVCVQLEPTFGTTNSGPGTACPNAPCSQL